MTLYQNEKKSYYEQIRKRALNEKYNYNSNDQYGVSKNSDDKAYKDMMMLEGKVSSKRHYFGDSKGKKKFNIVNRIIQELAITFVLFVLIFGCKAINTPESIMILDYAKEIYSVDYEKIFIEKYNETDINDVIQFHINYIKNIFGQGDINKIDKTVDNDSTNKSSNKSEGLVNEFDNLKKDMIPPSNGKVIEDKENLIDSNSILIDTKAGSDIFNSIDGTVRRIMKDDNTLNTVIIVNENGIETSCSGIDEIYVKQGDNVEKGEVLGKSGKIGKDKIEAIIFKVSYKGESVDPRKIVEKEM